MNQYFFLINLEERHAQLIWKSVVAMHKYISNESMVLPHFPMDLRFGTTAKTAIADFVIIHLDSYISIAISENKDVRNEIANSEPHLMAEIIAASQSKKIKSNLSSKINVVFDEDSREQYLNKQKLNLTNNIGNLRPPPSISEL